MGTQGKRGTRGPHSRLGPGWHWLTLAIPAPSALGWVWALVCSGGLGTGPGPPACEQALGDRT